MGGLTTCMTPGLWVGNRYGHVTMGVATKFYLGGDGFIGTQTYLPPKFSFSSDFGHFILKMVENAKKIFVSRKKDAEMSYFLGGRPPLIFRLRGTRPPVPPLSTPMHVTRYNIGFIAPIMIEIRLQVPCTRVLQVERRRRHLSPVVWRHGPMMTSLGQALSLCLRVTFAIVLVAILANMAYGLYSGFADFYRDSELKPLNWWRHWRGGGGPMFCCHTVTWWHLAPAMIGSGVKKRCRCRTWVTWRPAQCGRAVLVQHTFPV